MFGVALSSWGGVLRAERGAALRTWVVEQRFGLGSWSCDTDSSVAQRFELRVEQRRTRARRSDSNSSWSSDSDSATLGGLHAKVELIGSEMRLRLKRILVALRDAFAQDYLSPHFFRNDDVYVEPGVEPHQPPQILDRQCNCRR